MMRSESTSAFGQPRETNEILGAGALIRVDRSSSCGVNSWAFRRRYARNDGGATGRPLAMLLPLGHSIRLRTLLREGQATTPMHKAMLSRRTFVIALAGAPLAACSRPKADALDLAAAPGTTGSYAALKEP